VIVWTWDVDGPQRSACGVTDAEGSAKRAVETAMRATGAGTATVEACAHLAGLGWMQSGYRRTGVFWTATADEAGDIRWRMGNRRLAIAS
jgi:hypothetical protein